MFVADHHTSEQLQDLAQAIPQKRTLAARPGRRPRQAGADRPGHRRRPGLLAPRRSRTGSPSTTAAAIEALHERPRSGRPPLPGPGAVPPVEATPRRPAPARGRRLHPPGRRRPADPRAGIRRPDEPPGRLRPAPSPRLQQPDAPAPARGRQPRGAGVLQGDRRRADRRHRRRSTRTRRCGSTSRTRRGSARRGRSRGSGPAKGSRPRAVRQNGREWLYVLMAVCAATGAASALIMPELNTAVVNLFLEQFSRRAARGGPCGADLGRGGLSTRAGIWWCRAT